MHSYNYRSVKAISEYRYPQSSKNQANPSRIWRKKIQQMEPIPVKRKQRSNNGAPDRSRAA